MSTLLTPAKRMEFALSRREADRVPFVVSTLMQGARELGMSIRDYFSQPKAVVEGQLRLQRKYRGDALLGFLYASQEIEAFGGETVFREDGPPNAGAPVIRRPEDIDRLVPPRVEDSPSLLRVLRVIEGLKASAGDDIPVMGAVISPWSLPIMQMGFAPYLDLMMDDPARFERLVRINEEFTVAWANAQLRAGAAFINYSDSVSSPTITPRDLYLRVGLPSACRTIARIQGACAASFASGRVLPILDDVARTGVVGIAACADEDLAATKEACRGRLVVMGNLNALEMRHWSAAEAEAQVKGALAAAGPGGGFVLTDTHGEIPWQVPDEILLALADAVERWGRYPLSWVGDHAA